MTAASGGEGGRGGAGAGSAEAAGGDGGGALGRLAHAASAAPKTHADESAAIRTTRRLSVTEEVGDVSFPPPVRLSIMNPSLASVLRTSWNDFLDTYEPLRSGARGDRDAARRARAAGAGGRGARRPRVPDAFCAAFNAGDLDRITALLLDTASVEVVGATTQYGPEAARRAVLWGMLFGGARIARRRTAGSSGASCSACSRRLRVEGGADGDRVARIHDYFFDLDFIGEVCGELGVPWRSNGYRWFLPKG